MNAILPVPHFQQSAEGYCLPACARMALAYLGVQQAERELSRTLATRQYGTPSYAIQKLANKRLQVVYQEWSVPELLLRLEQGQPLIVFVRTLFLDYYEDDFAHALVIVGAEPQECFLVHDPLQGNGPYGTRWDGLLAAWAEFDYHGAVMFNI
jgi:ABC-type bacteriocin/lantibiotic exporter with double-glycine peptidase domain